MLNRNTLSRRQFLQLSGAVGATALMAACSPAAAPEPAPGPGGESATPSQTAPLHAFRWQPDRHGHCGRHRLWLGRPAVGR